LFLLSNGLDSSAGKAVGATLICQWPEFHQPKGKLARPKMRRLVPDRELSPAHAAAAFGAGGFSSSAQRVVLGTPPRHFRVTFDQKPITSPVPAVLRADRRGPPKLLLERASERCLHLRRCSLDVLPRPGLALRVELPEIRDGRVRRLRHLTGTLLNLGSSAVHTTASTPLAAAHVAMAPDPTLCAGGSPGHRPTADSTHPSRPASASCAWWGAVYSSSVQRQGTGWASATNTNVRRPSAMS